MTRARWWVLTLLFIATTINYFDRIVFSVLYPLIRDDLHISLQDYGWITSSFTAAYMLGFLIMGKLIDRFGTRVGYAVAIAWWAASAACHSLARSAVQLAFWRAMLGLGESGNFPAAIKTVAEWFPPKDRAFATGIFNAGSNVASMIGPPVFVALAATVGWRACFLGTASVDFVWLALWLLTYQPPERNRRVNAAEMAYISGDTPAAEEPKVGWLQSLEHRQTWAFALAKFLTDPVWWFYLFWLPPYFNDMRHFNLKEIGWALPVIYIMADVGSVAGGWVSGFLMRRGWEHARARKATMAFFACCMPFAALNVLVSDPLVAIALVSLATAAHQGWSANLFTTTSDVFPKCAVASVTGIGGCAGGVGGTIFSGVAAGFIVSHFGYVPMFLLMGVFHPVAWLVVHWLMGRMQPIGVGAFGGREIRTA